jgi:hypothetical protein
MTAIKGSLEGRPNCEPALKGNGASRATEYRNDTLVRTCVSHESPCKWLGLDPTLNVPSHLVRTTPEVYLCQENSSAC